MRVLSSVLAYYLLAVCLIASRPLPEREESLRSTERHLDYSLKKADEDAPEKYFHESTFHQHYDGRFAHQELPYEDRRTYLVALIQTYLSTMNDIGVETFIMHGALLGWWWNRRIMPFDNDIDVMVSESSIYYLARYYNMTVHGYLLSNNEAIHDYVLDINPHYRKDGLDLVNKIDARWIDMNTGLFIDITTIRPNRTAEGLDTDGNLMVKDGHQYRSSNVYPLRESVFEGVSVNVPYAYEKVLFEEYGITALTETTFKNHRYDDKEKAWVPLSCKDFGSCDYFRNKVDGINLPANVLKADDRHLSVR